MNVVMAERFSSFSPFSRLPKELQIKIWEFSIEGAHIVPRVIRIKYQPSTESLSYSFTAQPILEVCRLSRKIALKVYIPLVSHTAPAIYFNPKVDFIYSNFPYDPTVPASWGPWLSPDSAVLPLVPLRTNISSIRFLVLDRLYLYHRSSINLNYPIKELRDFKSLKEIFIVVLSLQQRMVLRVKLEERRNYLPGQRRWNYEEGYAKELLHDAALLSAPVPGFNLYSPFASAPEDSHRVRRHLLNSLTWQEGTPRLPLPSFQFGQSWRGTMLPKVTEIRAVEPYTPADREIIRRHFETERARRENCFREQTSFGFGTGSEDRDMNMPGSPLG